MKLKIVNLEKGHNDQVQRLQSKITNIEKAHVDQVQKLKTTISNLQKVQNLNRIQTKAKPKVQPNITAAIRDHKMTPEVAHSLAYVFVILILI